MTDPENKTEDYREITTYWCARFILVEGKIRSIQWWIDEFEYSEKTQISIEAHIFKHFYLGSFIFKQFTTNTMTLGYPSNDQTERIKRFEHLGIEIREGREEWGAEKGKLYFVIKHGKRI